MPHPLLTRRFRALVFYCIALWSPSVYAESIDLADPASVDRWFSHPVIGEASYDAFDRSPANPIHAGKPPWEWPVNGSLFEDPRSRDWYCHISLYPKGYWPAGPSLLLRSNDRGKSWEDRGLSVQGDPSLFDGDQGKGGCALDVTEVADEDGYHLSYGWTRPDNSDGGIGYAFSKSPEGPFDRRFPPVHQQSKQPVIPPGYQRVYASTIVKRAHDWLTIASMSTPGNAGGMWALVALTAPRAEGPWSPPTFLRAPHLPEWYPQPIEFCPGFTHEGHVYAALTSVAANRCWQLLLRAPTEQAHRRDAWTVHRAGSLFHAEPNAWEAMGIWGQSFGGFVGSDGLLHVMYPSRNDRGVGTINLASRRWDTPMRRGFWVSAPNAPSLALLPQEYGDFALEAQVETSGPFRVVFDHRAPLGPDRSHAESRLHPLSQTRQINWRVDAAGWELQRYDEHGQVKVLASAKSGIAPASAPAVAQMRLHRLRLSRSGERVQLQLDEETVRELSLEADRGGIGFLAEVGTCLHITRCGLAASSRPAWRTLLPLEGLIGGGQLEGNWTKQTSGFRFETGYGSDKDTAIAKWNFTGRGVRLWLPRGPAWGRIRIRLNGGEPVEVDLHGDAPQPSSVVWERPEIPAGRHALLVERVSGMMPVDCVDVLY